MLCCYLNYVYLVIILIISLIYFWLRYSPQSKRVCIVVLGDIGRSPRMQYHASSFSKSGYFVNLIGYGGSVPHKDILHDQHIRMHSMIEPPKFIKSIPRILGYAVKAVWQSVFLVMTLCLRPKPSHMLLQNPPSIPTMAVCWFVCLLRGSKFIIDWHNYGYTILSLSLSSNHQLVKFSKWYEHYFGKLASNNICVTDAMKEDLKENWKISANTHYDRPPEMFKSIDLETQHQLYVKLSKTYKVFQSRSNSETQSEVERTAFTVKLQDQSVHKLQCRPAILVSSTSWTDFSTGDVHDVVFPLVSFIYCAMAVEDEDFSILFSALKKYEEACANPPIMVTLPKLVCVITGKGPMKDHYLQLIEKTDFKHIEFCTPWLEAEDYPTLLASSDLGACLHTSSSGLDLPMKVVDMFGCGLPVCAICFKCLPELVKHEQNGMVFHCGHELAQQIQDLLQGFPDRCEKLEKYRKNLTEFQKTRWHETWRENVLPLFS